MLCALKFSGEMIFDTVKAESFVQPYQGSIIRLVESQTKASTAAILDDLEEQSIFENLLESSKPISVSTKQHYLLSTPFRYPPLRHGSRFGATTERGIFYASTKMETALAETAFYRFYYILATDGTFPNQRKSFHTSFHVTLQANRSLRLEQVPFDAYQDRLTSPTDYSFCQTLGAQMRSNKIDAFSYLSARDPMAGLYKPSDEEQVRLNVGVFHPETLVSQPSMYVEWTAILHHESITFTPNHTHQRIQYSLQQFLVNNQFPQPVA